jgi:phage shock protein A
MSDATPQPPAPDYDENGVPSLEYLRDKIEGKYATALGATELAEGDERVQDQAEQQAERDKKAADRLAEIRKTLG